MRTRIAIALLFLMGLAVADTDPSPRFQFLGTESIQGPRNHAGPAYAFVYRDRATGEEIICFSGDLRETLSCFESGRNRGKN